MTNSWGLTLIAILAVLLLIVAVGVVISRRPGRREPKPQEPERNTRNDDGSRPEHFDPDPEGMAGGRARFTPPERGPRP